MRQAHFFIRTIAGRQRLGAIHLKSLVECRVEILDQLFSGAPLRINPWNFLDPADPPITRLLNNGGEP